MAFTFVDLTESSVGANPATNAAIGFNSAVAIGDLLIIAITTPNTNTDVVSAVADTLGNTYARAAYSPTQLPGERSYIYWCQSAFAGANTAVVTHSHTQALKCVEVRVTVSSGTATLDKTFETNGAASSATGTLTNCAANSFVWANVINDSSNYASPSGYTAGVSAGTWNLEDMDYTNDSGAFADEVITWGGSANWTACAASFTTGGGASIPIIPGRRIYVMP